MTTSASTDNNDDKSNLDYFAIGSMLNPISIRNRGIHPISSEPAELLNFRIGFFTSRGYAEAIAEEGNSCHGVIHHLSKQDMEKLDKIEQLYDRKTATAKLYDGTTRQVTVYVQSDLKHEGRDSDDAPPQERYLEIMIAGCKHYGVDPKYIEFLEKHERVPRPSPDEYLSFGSTDHCDDKTMTLDEVFENNGKDDKPLMIVAQGKVVECKLDRDSADFIEHVHMFDSMGQICELFISKVEYDPKFGLPKTLDDVTPEHAAYCEHGFCSYHKMKGSLDKWEVVAKLDTSGKK